MTRCLRHGFVAALLFVSLLVSTAAAAVYARIPAGTPLQVRVSEKLSSETARPGQAFHGTLAAPVVANGRTLFPKGAPVTGQVVNVKRSGRLSSPGELYLALRTIRSGGRSYAVTANTFVIKGESHTKSNVAKIGGGAAAGAILGAIIGGGKGAAIGAGVGAAGGTTVAAASGKKPAVVESEAVLAWVAANPQASAAVPTNSGDQDAYSNDAPAYRDREPQYEPSARRYRDDDDRDDRYRDDDDDRDRDHRYRDDDDGHGYYGRGPEGFSDRDREIISDCMAGGDTRGLPPGLAKRDRLPPGLERQLQRNGTLPPGLQKRVQPLPGYCVDRLPPLPTNFSRVVVSGRVLLLGPGQRIVDMFVLANF